MTLTRLLEVNLRLIRYEDERGLRLAEEVWKLNGGPTEADALSETIEKALQCCSEEGISYPAILLKRKKQIERGIWKPDLSVEASGMDSIPSEGDTKCGRCGGVGYVLIEGGRHSKFCECNKWVRNQAIH